MIPIEDLTDVTLAIQDTDKDDESDEDDEDDEDNEDIEDIEDADIVETLFKFSRKLTLLDSTTQVCY